MRYTIKNDRITAEIDSLGAELKSLRDAAGREYLWQADPKYWNRTSPVLFPIVGAVHGGQYTLDGKVYRLGQHGFARDMEFALMRAEEQELWFSLEETEETLRAYPFRFRLELGYRLEGDSLRVLWRVKNPDDRALYFSIGGHPAFNTPLTGKGKQTDCFLKFDRTHSFMKTAITEEGITDTRVLTTLENGRLKLSENTFRLDAVIIEDRQVQRVSLCQPDGSVYVTVDFDFPLVGIWSRSAEAPFVCIEPWCGLADRIGWAGDFKDRPYTNCLAPGGVWERGYRISLGDGRDE